MKTRWSERWSWQFILAIAAMLGLMLLIGVVSEALAGHAVAAEAQVAWQAQLDRVDEALGRNDQAQALLLWREAYAAALRSRHWQGLVAVGDTYRRLGAHGGFEKAAVAKARQTYLVALFRARQEGSVDGVLRVADAFAELGDDAVVQQCLAIARRPRRRRTTRAPRTAFAPSPSAGMPASSRSRNRPDRSREEASDEPPPADRRRVGARVSRARDRGSDGPSDDPRRTQPMIDRTNDSSGPWREHIRAMDQALGEANATVAVRAWRNAYAAALGTPGWHGLVEVAAASLRIGKIPGFGKASEARARETYWTALFRARQQGSLNGVLEAAEAFGALGDRQMVEQCIRVAESLAALNADAGEAERVRALAANLADRYLRAQRAEAAG